MLTARKVLVTGSRNFSDRHAVNEALHTQLELYTQDPVQILIVIHGCAPGADTFASEWAVNWYMPEWRFPADWMKHGRAAGPVRNRLMYDTSQPDIVLAFPLPGSKGTIDMIEYARSHGCEVLVHES